MNAHRTMMVMTLAFMSGGANVTRAQSALLGPGTAFFGIGTSGITTAPLDDRLAARGYPAMGRTAMAFNVGLYRILSGGVTLGAEWHGLNIGHGTRDGRAVDLGGGYGTIGIGYMVQLSPRARIYPRLGLGGGGLGLWLERDSATAGFDEVLADPEPVPVLRDPVLSRGGVVVDLGAGGEFLLRARGSGVLLGVRLGYLAAPSSNDWRLYSYFISDGPAATLAGPYIRALIGVAWKR